MSTKSCQELLLDDVVAVSVYRASDCSIAIPPQIKLTTIATINANQTPVFVANMEGGDDKIMMQEMPTLKITNQRSAAGNVFTHDLQISVAFGRTLAESVLHTLQGIDFYVVYDRADGSRSFSYSLPNTSLADIDESFSATQTVQLKLKVQSMSELITITE